MPAYNATSYLDESIESILGQTFRNFEFIIINDGSTDATASILGRYAARDSRIRVYHQENQGMIAALNRGCRLARGEYIARMDADDVSFPQRLEKQLEYIERHPHIGVLGTWIYNIDQNGSLKKAWRPPTYPKLLKWTNFFGVCVSHSSVLMRREVLERLSFYRPEAVHGEDVDLWLRASSITEFGNVPEVLNNYRVWSASTHQSALQVRREAHIRLLASYIRDFIKVDVPVEAVAGLRQTRVGPPPDRPEQSFLTAALIEELYENFLRTNNLTLEERRDISWDAAKRMASLSLNASRFSTRASVSLFRKALKLNSRLLYPSAIVKGLQRALRDRFEM
jgi:glycosyltransferase involved in cell wall biosynthesis